MSQPGSCVYTIGDANSSGDFNGLDVTYSVNYFKDGPAPEPCPDCMLIGWSLTRRIKRA